MRSAEQANLHKHHRHTCSWPCWRQAAAPRGRLGHAPADADDPFKVDFFVEDSAQLQVSTAAVKCAAQLYYVMTLGDELGVFDAVRYFTHRYLFRDGFAIEDRTLRATWRTTSSPSSSRATTRPPASSG